MKVPTQLKPVAQKGQQVLRFFHQPGDNKPGHVPALEEYSHLKARIEYCKDSEEHRADEKATLEKLTQQKSQLTTLKAQYTTMLQDDKVQRGFKTASALTLGNMVLPYLWHKLTDSADDATCRAQIQPGFVLSVLSMVTNGYVAYSAFIAPRVENYDQTLAELTEKIAVLDSKIADCKEVLRQSEPELVDDRPRSASMSAAN